LLWVGGGVGGGGGGGGVGVFCAINFKSHSQGNCLSYGALQ